MSAPGTRATTLIITKGLACGNILNGNNITRFGAGITPFFGLYIEVKPIQPRRTAGGGGGRHPYVTRPMQPGEIQNFYKLLPPEQQFYIIPRDKETQYFSRNKIVIIKIKVGDRENEISYAVPENKAKLVIRVINIANATKEKIRIAATHIRRVFTDIIIKARSVRVRKNK